MSSTVQKVMNDLSQLTPEEKWQVMRLLMDQLQSSVRLVKTADTTDNLDIPSLIAETRGIWGHKSLDEIDAMLNRQRRTDWGE